MITNIKSTRKNTEGSTTICDNPCAIEKILVGKGGDQCLMTVYDDTTVLWEGILNDEYLRMGKQNKPYEIDFKGRQISTNLKVTLHSPAATSHFKMNAITGTTVTDSGSLATDGTATNMANEDWVGGKIHNGIDFDGADDHVMCGNVNAFASTEAFSFSFWVYAHALAGTEYLFAKRQVTSEKGYGCYFDSSNTLWFHILGTPNTASMIVKVTTTFAENELNLWWHYTITYDGSEDAEGIKIYRQAAPLRTQITDNDIAGTCVSTTELQIGAMRGAANGFDGLIDDFRVYAEELTPEEVKLIYNGGVGTEDDFSVADITVIYEE